MSLYMITFSDSSDSSDDISPQLFKCDPVNNKIPNKVYRRPLPCCHHVKSIVHTMKITPEASNFASYSHSSSSISYSSQKNSQVPSSKNIKKETLTQKNGKIIISSNPSTPLPNNVTFNRLRRIKPIIIQANSTSYESDSYDYSYSYDQYDSRPEQKNESNNKPKDLTNINNLPRISQNNQLPQDVTTNNDVAQHISSSCLDSNEVNSLDQTNNNNNIEKNVNIEVQKTLKVQKPELINYRIDRQKHGVSIRGKCWKFTLSGKMNDNSSKNNEDSFRPIIDAIVTGTKVSFIDANTHDVIGMMKAKKKFSRFVISKAPYGQVVLEISYKSFNNVKPRSFTIKIYDKIFSQIAEHHNNNSNEQNTDSEPKTEKNIIQYENIYMLKNRVPKRSAYGMWSLDFGQRKIISSIKNSIIVDANDIEYAFMGKIGENSLSVEAAKGMDLTCVLGIAVSSFLYPKP